MHKGLAEETPTWRALTEEAAHWHGQLWIQPPFLKGTVLLNVKTRLSPTRTAISKPEAVPGVGEDVGDTQ